MWFSDNKCNPGVGAVPVIMIVLLMYISNLYLFFCIRSSNAEKLTVLHCYDHNLNSNTYGY